MDNKHEWYFLNAYKTCHIKDLLITKMITALISETANTYIL